MGRPKLSLPLPGGQTVLGRVLDALQAGGAGPILVVGPPRDAPGWDELSEIVDAAGSLPLVIPDEPTPDMRSSFDLGLAALELDSPGVLLAPGDSVGITRRLVSQVIAAFLADPSRLVIPLHGGHRGHPVALPLDLLIGPSALPPGLGLNAIRERNPDRVFLLEVDEPGALDDLDTPDDYARWASPSEASPPAT
jgi:molybdenum cofactor cytidylyltransferase